jgi:hypothetical protein
MKKMIFAGLVLSSMTLLSACGGTWGNSNVGESSASVASATQTSEIKLYAGDFPTRPYKVLKKHLLVTVNKTTALHPPPTSQMVKVKMQKEAAKLGADAIIFATISSTRIGFASWGVREGKGTAIQFTN